MADAGGITVPLIDAHCHFWALARGDYGWLDGTGGPLAPIRRDFAPADYPGTARLVVVQAAPSLAETDYLLALAATEPRIAGVVGWADLSDPGLAAVLRPRAANPALRGIRPMLQDIAETDWLAARVPPEALGLLAELGLRLDALVTERHLPMLYEVAARHPGLGIVVDHAAKPQPGARAGWAEAMRRLSTLPHVHCKLSGLLTELSPAERADPLPALRRIVEPLLDWYGPERLIWGSDWPVLTLAASWQDWRDLTDALLDGLAPGAAAAVLHGNAARFYGLSP